MQQQSGDFWQRVDRTEPLIEEHRQRRENSWDKTLLKNKEGTGADQKMAMDIQQRPTQPGYWLDCPCHGAENGRVNSTAGRH